MILGLSGRAELWEQVAAVQIAQAIPSVEVNSAYFSDPVLLDIANLKTKNRVPDVSLQVTDAYRAAESSGLPYADILAEVSGLKVQSKAPAFSLITSSDAGGIVVCPFGLRSELDLPLQVWAPIVAMLRSYLPDVGLMGNANQRMDSAQFTEAEIMSNWSLGMKMAALSGARLILGVPNAYTWISTAWEKKMVMLIPDSVPVKRWFGFQNSNFGVFQFPRNQVQVPVLLAAIRTLISRL